MMVGATECEEKGFIDSKVTSQTVCFSINNFTVFHWQNSICASKFCPSHGLNVTETLGTPSAANWSFVFLYVPAQVSEVQLFAVV